MKLSWQKKWKNREWIQLVSLSPVTLSRTCKGGWSLHSHVFRLHEKHILCILKQLVNSRCIVGIYIFLLKPFFVFSSMGRRCLQYVWYLSRYGIFWTSICLIIRLWVVNQRLSQFFSKINKSIISLEEIFHRQIFIHFSARYEKSKNLNGVPGCSPCIIQTNLGFSPNVMPQGIVIFHCPPCIYNDPLKLQYTRTWLTPNSPYFSLTYDPLAQSNPKRLKSS